MARNEASTYIELAERPTRRSEGSEFLLIGTNGDEDVTVKIIYCGICHSDLHSIKDELGFSIYPVVPGHEIAGVVTQIGCKVGKFKIGDRVGVGCLIGSCRRCSNCEQDLENYCPKRINTYTIFNDGTRNYGGYSDIIVVNEHFVVHFPDNLPLDRGAPLLCAGITVYSPMKYYGLNESGQHLGVVGLGGLGHVAVKFAKAFGMKVTVISRSESKKKEAIERLGADLFLVSSDPEQMQAAMGTMDGIISTFVTPDLITSLIHLLKPHGKLIFLSATDKPVQLPLFPLLTERKLVAGSIIGGLKETQEMLDFAGEHNITSDIEVISMDYVNTAMERLARGDVRYRFVIDIANTLTV
uniref:Enoyl reductase (ER) domain-containing protein n=1 Tax=Nelumbo nucifera TaxID=4432 RepID=A0A822ZEM1_NELNU|nr:TPA_asm: hypothetical protein HUJ06_001567 [Nelumbo nucifera]